MPLHPTRQAKVRLRSGRALTSFSSDDELDLSTEHEDDVSKAHRSVLQLADGDIRLPDKVGFDKVSSSCKFAATDTVTNGDVENPQAENLSPAIGKSANCSGMLGHEILTKTLGSALPEPSDDSSGSGSHLKGLFSSSDEDSEAGLRLTGSTDVKLGSVLREQLKAAQDACHDFGSRVIHFLGDPDTRQHVQSPVLTPNMAAHLLQTFGRCMQSIGNATAMQGCEIGRLQETGPPDVRHMCHLLEPDDEVDDTIGF